MAKKRDQYQQREGQQHPAPQGRDDDSHDQGEMSIDSGEPVIRNDVENDEDCRDDYCRQPEKADQDDFRRLFG